MNKSKNFNQTPSRFKQILAGLLQLSFLSSPLNGLAKMKTSDRSFPGANRSPASSSNSLNSGATQDLSVGSYVELNESIQNDMYGTIQFENAQLKDIVLAISKVANKNFILDRKLDNRQVTIISPEPVTKQEAYYAFLSALNMNGLTVVSGGKFLKIIEIKSAIQANTRVFVGDYAPPSEEIVTVLYTLKHLNAEDIERFVTEMVPRTGRVTAYPDTNTLVMTDTGINLRRVMAVLKSIDTPGYQEQLENIPIRYGSAKGIAQLIQDILDAQNPTGARIARPGTRNVQKTRGGGIISKIVPDERTNSLVVLANGRGIKELKDLIAKLDTASASGNGNIHIYYCKNAVAEELAATLNSLLSGNKSSSSSSDPNANRSGAAASPFAGLSTPAPSTSRSSRSGGDNVSLSGDLKITADKATNALVVVASGSDYSSLKSILAKLDIPRRQVYVEATIMEIKNSDQDEFGVIVNVAQPGVPTAFRSAPDNIIKITDLANAATLNGLIAGFSAGNTVSVNGTNIPTVFGLIKALDKSTVGQILHQPQILTSDNQEAEIKVVDEVPVPKQEYTLVTSTTGSTSSLPTVTYSKENIEISLKITPQIGEDNDLVKLKVLQNVDDFIPTGTDGQIQKTKRSANTSVSVRSGDTIAIGGLQKISGSNTRSRYPLLGDLPIIGWLFKGSTKADNRSNLILFLTPHIISSYSDLQKISEHALDERLNISKKARDPRDENINEVKKILTKVREDAKKEPPKAWSLKAENASKGSEKNDSDEPAANPNPYIPFDKPVSKDPLDQPLPPPPEQQQYYAAPPAQLTNPDTKGTSNAGAGVDASTPPSTMPPVESSPQTGSPATNTTPPSGGTL